MFRKINVIILAVTSLFLLGSCGKSSEPEKTSTSQEIKFYEGTTVPMLENLIDIEYDGPDYAEGDPPTTSYFYSGKSLGDLDTCVQNYCDYLIESGYEKDKNSDGTDFYTFFPSDGDLSHAVLVHGYQNSAANNEDTIRVVIYFLGD